MKHASLFPASIASRRQFIGSAAAAVASAAIPTVVTRPLLGAAAPSNRVNVAQIGRGNIGSNYHIPTLLGMADVRIVGDAEAAKLLVRPYREK